LLIVSVIAFGGAIVALVLAIRPGALIQRGGHVAVAVAFSLIGLEKSRAGFWFLLAGCLMIVLERVRLLLKSFR
jgi:hypothetical protein